MPETEGTSSTFYYFRMKVGTGNCLFHLCLLKGIPGAQNSYPATDREKAELEKKAFEHFSKADAGSLTIDLYTGYDSDDWIPVLQSNGESESSFNFCFGHTPDLGIEATTSIDDVNNNHVSQENDLFFMACAVGKPFSNRTRILVYGKTYLFVFRPMRSAWYKWNPYPMGVSHSLPLQLGKDLRQAWKKNEVELNDFLRTQKAWGGALKVKLDNCVPRQALPPAIDSLAVYQWLNQGTFRPLFSCGRGRENYMPKKITPSLPQIQIFRNGSAITAVADHARLECRYAALIRSQFDRLFEGTARRQPLHNDSDDDYVYLLLSPAQLEAAAALLCMDLGYLPDFYVAGSHDYIDVRAREARQLNASGELRCRIAAVLDEKWKWANELELQSKNYEAADNTADDNVILFEPLPLVCDQRNNNQRRLSLKKVYDVQCELQRGRREPFLLKSWLDSQRGLLGRKDEIEM